MKGIVTAALIAGLAITAPPAYAQVVAITPTRLSLRSIATVNLTEIANGASGESRSTPTIEQLQPVESQHASMVNRRIPITSAPAGDISDLRTNAALLLPPRAVSTRLAGPRASQIFGFNALDALDTAIGNGLDVNAPATGFAIEPPDPALCAGDGEVVEMTDRELVIYDINSNDLPHGPVIGIVSHGPFTLSSIFGVPSSDFIADPKCYYDAPTKRFYMTLTDLTDQTTHSSLLVAVMAANSTTVNSYQIDTTDDGTGGTPIHQGCPCYGDQPLLGANADALFVTTNEFTFSGSTFTGAELYLISKLDLAAALASPRTYSITGGLPAAGGFASSVQPATSPDGVFNTAQGGTEFMMSALDFAGTGDNRIAVWAVTNTCILASSPCSNFLGLTLAPPIVRVRPYANPPSAIQPAGPIPYGNATGNTAVEQIDSNDDRLGQLIYADGRLYAALGTQMQVGGAEHAGVEYFVVKPALHTTVIGGPGVAAVEVTLSARLLRSGYVAHSGTDIYYPSIGVTRGGRAVIGFSLSGANLYPSAGWMPLADAGAREIHIAGTGAAPEDGYSGYPNDNLESSSIAGWGAYSAAVADGDKIWMAAEYIPFGCTDARYALDPLCGLSRAPEANWSTFISVFPSRVLLDEFDPGSTE